MIHRRGHVRRAAVELRRRGPVTFTVIAASAVVACSTVTVVSDAVARNEALSAELGSERARSITITATNPDTAPIPRSLALSIASLPGVIEAVALTAPRTAVNALVRESPNTIGIFGFQALKGDIPISMTAGRAAQAQEVLLSTEAARRLGVARPAIGSIEVEGTVMPTVGSFEPTGQDQLAELLGSSAVTPIPPEVPVDLVSLLVQTPADVAAVAGAIQRILAPLGASSYLLDLDQRTADVERVVRTTTRAATRSLAIGILISGGIAAGLISFLTSLARRRDLARQRALGSTRLDLIVIAAMQSGALAFVGSALGSAIGTAYLSGTDGINVNLGLPVSVTIAVVAIQSLAILPGAAFGAVQDPARILRVP